MYSSRTYPWGEALAFSGEVGIHMIALPARKVVKSALWNSAWSEPGVIGPVKSVTRLTVGGFELVKLRIALAGDFALRRLAVKIGTGAVVQSRAQVDPNLRIRIATVFRSFGSLSQPETDQKLVEGGKIRVWRCRLASTRAPGNRCSTARRAHRVVGPDAPANHDQNQYDRNRQIEISATRPPETAYSTGGVRSRERFQKVPGFRRGTPDNLLVRRLLHQGNRGSFDVVVIALRLRWQHRRHRILVGIRLERQLRRWIILFQLRQRKPIWPAKPAILFLDLGVVVRLMHSKRARLFLVRQGSAGSGPERILAAPLHLPRRRQLALHAGRPAVAGPRCAALAAKLFLAQQFVAALPA